MSVSLPAWATAGVAPASSDPLVVVWSGIAADLLKGGGGDGVVITDDDDVDRFIGFLFDADCCVAAVGFDGSLQVDGSCAGDFLFNYFAGAERMREYGRPLGDLIIVARPFGARRKPGVALWRGSDSSLVVFKSSRVMRDALRALRRFDPVQELCRQLRDAVASGALPAEKAEPLLARWEVR